MKQKLHKSYCWSRVCPIFKGGMNCSFLCCSRIRFYMRGCWLMLWMEEVKIFWKQEEGGVKWSNEWCGVSWFVNRWRVQSWKRKWEGLGWLVIIVSSEEWGVDSGWQHMAALVHQSNPSIAPPPFSLHNSEKTHPSTLKRQNSSSILSFILYFFSLEQQLGILFILYKKLILINISVKYFMQLIKS